MCRPPREANDYRKQYGSHGLCPRQNPNRHGLKQPAHTAAPTFTNPLNPPSESVFDPCFIRG